VQFANKLGFRTVAIARGADKEALSRKLGAHHFIDNATGDVAAALNRLGGARAVLATLISAKAMTPVIDGLAVRGRLIVVGVDVEPLEVSPLKLIGASRSIVGHAAGASIDSQDTLVFSALSGVPLGKSRVVVLAGRSAGGGQSPIMPEIDSPVPKRLPRVVHPRL
jgi:D-arabinose 1-dehydrogenase-like Zn-dependent alcohol dehydrogenase